MGRAPSSWLRERMNQAKNFFQDSRLVVYITSSKTSKWLAQIEQFGFSLLDNFSRTSWSTNAIWSYHKCMSGARTQQSVDDDKLRCGFWPIRTPGSSISLSIRYRTLNHHSGCLIFLIMLTKYQAASQTAFWYLFICAIRLQLYVSDNGSRFWWAMIYTWSKAETLQFPTCSSPVGGWNSCVLDIAGQHVDQSKTRGILLIIYVIAAAF